MDTLRTFVLGAVLASLAASATRCAEQELVKLTIDEEAGAARANEPVTVGVPFPEGAVKDVALLELRDEAGNAVPAQFTEASKWRTAKGGVHWAHLDFQTSIPAKGKKAVTVVLRDVPAPAAATPPKITVALENNVATVVAGPVKFVVRGAKFNGFEGAWFDPSGKRDYSEANVVIPPGGSGGCRVEAGGKIFSSLNDPDGKVEIESQGPMKVVVKATGCHKAAEGDEKRFDYVVRFYAYANSPVVRVQHTFVNRQGSNPAAMLDMEALVLDVPTALAKPAVSIGTDAAPWSGPAEAPGAAAFQKSSDEFVVNSGGAEKTKGKGKSVKPLSLGWLDMGSGGKNLAVGLRWFWQMHPKEILAAPDGRLSLGLYPKAIGKPWDVYMGQSRTHDMTFLFHKGLGAAELNNFYTGTQMPLRPWAPSKYYCRDAVGFWFLAESDEKLFPPDKWPIAKSFDEKMASSLRQIRKKLDGFEYCGYKTDSYGFYNWGDTFHWGWAKQEKAPKDTYEWHLSWEGNYYDYPNLCLMQMMRTGNRDYYWHAFEPNTVHVRDVFTCQWHPKKHLWGACRYCPPRNHVAQDEGNPYVSNEFNHNKSQSVFAHWYLTGDWRTREVIDLMMNNGLNNHEPDSGFANRGMGMHLALVWQSWELTGEDKYYKRILQLMRCAGKELEKTGGEFMKGPDPGIGMEGIVYAHYATGGTDEYTNKILKLLVDRWVSKERSYQSSALLLAYGACVFENEKARELAWKALSKASASPRPKDTAEPNRNMPFALYFLSNVAKPPAGGGAEKPKESPKE